MPRFRMEPRDAREHLRSIQHPALRYVKPSAKQVRGQDASGPLRARILLSGIRFGGRPGILPGTLGGGLP